MSISPVTAQLFSVHSHCSSALCTTSEPSSSRVGTSLSCSLAAPHSVDLAEEGVYQVPIAENSWSKTGAIPPVFGLNYWHWPRQRGTLRKSIAANHGRLGGQLSRYCYYLYFSLIVFLIWRWVTPFCLSHLQLCHLLFFLFVC